VKLGDKIWIEGSTRATIESLENGKVLLARLETGGGWYRPQKVQGRK
jgi:hypothetical protein